LLKEHDLEPQRYLFAFKDVPDSENPPFFKTSMGKLVKAFPVLEPYLRPHSEQRLEIITASNLPAISGFTYIQSKPDTAVTSELTEKAWKN